MHVRYSICARTGLHALQVSMGPRALAVGPRLRLRARQVCGWCAALACSIGCLLRVSVSRVSPRARAFLTGGLAFISLRPDFSLDISLAAGSSWHALRHPWNPPGHYARHAGGAKGGTHVRMHDRLGLHLRVVPWASLLTHWHPLQCIQHGHTLDRKPRHRGRLGGSMTQQHCLARQARTVLARYIADYFGVNQTAPANDSWTSF